MTISSETFADAWILSDEIKTFGVEIPRDDGSFAGHLPAAKVS